MSNDFVEIEERVRYAETDRMGVAHHSNHLIWFEMGRSEFCRRKGLPYSEIEKSGYSLVVVEIFCRYKKPLKYEQKFLIRTYLEELNNKKAKFKYELINHEDSTIIAEGYSIHVVTNSEGKSSTLPDGILHRLKN
ncbi:MAG: thioesterase family protein [Acidobacteriota bacterium]